MDTDAHTHSDDIGAITHVVATIEHAQNNELAEEFIDLFRDDAIWTTGGGRRLFGREAIAEHTRRALPGSMGDGSSVTLELEHVLFLRPDAAAVKARQLYRTPDGSDLSSPLWVMTKEDGRWLLSAAQNTAVFDGEETPLGRAAPAGD